MVVLIAVEVSARFKFVSKANRVENIIFSPKFSKIFRLSRKEKSINIATCKLTQ